MIRTPLALEMVGTSAFTVKSESEITTTVPAGATTGTLQVVTPGGTLSEQCALPLAALRL